MKDDAKGKDGGLGSFLSGLSGGTSAAAVDPAQSDVNFIGVPDNYAYTRPGSATTSKPTPGSPSSWRMAESGAGFAPQLPIYRTGDELALTGLAPEDVWMLQRQMAVVGLIGPKQKFRRGDGGDPVTVNAFKKLMGYANKYGEDYVSALRRLASSPEGTAAENETGAFGAESAKFTGKRTRTDRSARLTDPKSAQELADKVLEEHLGRKATKDEYRRFVAALNGAEQANPSVTTTTESYVDGVGTGSTSTTTGGLDSAGVAQVGDDFVSGDKKLKAESDKFLTETDYFNAAMAALGSPQ